MPYLNQKTRLTGKGEWVEVVSKPHSNVWLIRNSKGEVHSVRVELLQDEPVVEVVVRIELPIDLFNQI